MCKICQDILLSEKFYSSKDWLDCLRYMKLLLDRGEFELVASTCDIDKVKANGKWVNDIIQHSIQCKTCGQIFICYANTYQGGGAFRKA